MRVIRTSADMQRAARTAARPLGFIPTMGYLHDGHISLIYRAREECATVAVSIFVNPTQFGPSEDLARYPRDLPRDLRMCEDAGVDIVFVPSAPEVYPEGHRTFIEVQELQDLWEGAARPGHFRGVATVVALLFRLARPDRAYFGEKDYQQLQIIRRLAADLFPEITVVGCPTVREADGLACSSRNMYLGPEHREKATVLYTALQAAQGQVARGERSCEALIQTMRDLVQETPGVELDYAAVVDPETLVPLARVEGEARALIAAHIGGVHLIDNAPLAPGTTGL